jgi:Peptidase A4 family
MKRTANHSNQIANEIAKGIVNSSTLTTATQKRTSGLLSLAAVLLCGLPASAQNAKVVAEQGFTIAPDIQNSIVLKTQADAACDLHAVGTSDTRSMRFYANGEGYVNIHASAREGIEGRVQLDCASSNGKAVSYPLHLVASSSPTSDMPAPQSKMPMPKGAKVRPALTEAQAQSITDAQLDKLGYPARPDVLTSPDQYAKWLDRVSKPITMMPTHLLSTNVTATPGSYTSNNWSGLEAHSTTQHQYSAVTAVWDVPPIPAASSDGNTDYSAFWVGLDGDGTKDLVQAGTEQDAQEFLGIVFTNYYTWSELLPNQPTENFVSGVNAGDEMAIEVWIGTGSGAPNANGSLGSFRITDVTQNQEWRFNTALDGTKYNGTEAEWIMERPTVGGSLPELAAYFVANMSAATALNAKTSKWVDSGTAANRNISMYNGKDELSEAIWLGKGSTLITFLWLNFE